MNLEYLVKCLVKMRKNDPQFCGSFFLLPMVYAISLNKTKAMKKKIAVHLAEGFEEIEAISIIDILRRAELEVLAVSVSGKLEVSGAHQIRIIADKLFEEVNYEEVFMMVLPGGMPGAANLDAHAGLKNQRRLPDRFWLKQKYFLKPVNFSMVPFSPCFLPVCAVYCVYIVYILSIY